jgi:hypothetical protein
MDVTSTSTPPNNFVAFNVTTNSPIYPAPTPFAGAEALLTGVPAGRYIYSVQFTGTATVVLQALMPKAAPADADVWLDISSKTATGTAELNMAGNATLRVHVVSGTPANLAASIGRFG